MKRLLIASLALLGSGAALAEPVAVNVQNLQPKIAAEVVKHAQDGEKSLARYLERVRPYQRLSFEDVTRPADQREPLTQRREYRKHAADWHLASRQTPI